MPPCFYSMVLRKVLVRVDGGKLRGLNYFNEDKIFLILYTPTLSIGFASRYAQVLKLIRDFGMALCVHTVIIFNVKDLGSDF